jgi:hypothetical protein
MLCNSLKSSFIFKAKSRRCAAEGRGTICIAHHSGASRTRFYFRTLHLHVTSTGSVRPSANCVSQHVNMRSRGTVVCYVIIIAAP